MKGEPRERCERCGKQLCVCARTQLMEKLAAKYAPPHWMFLEEVRDATGFDSGRAADAMALGLYRSRGRDLIAFEVKVSRSDWLLELKNPDKAEAIGRYCDYFYLVLAEEGIIQPGEVPEPWGVYVARPKKLVQIKAAQRLEAAPISRLLLCSLVKSAADAREEILRAGMKEEIRAGVKGERATWDYRLRTAEEKAQRTKEAVEAFEAASGVAINQWGDAEGNRKIGTAVRAILEGGAELRRMVNRLERMKEISADVGKQAAGQAAEITTALVELGVERVAACPSR